MRALPPLTALRAFEAAGRLLSFQGAARELALTPTAISHQIRLLEDYCGQALFRRRPRPLALTTAGERLLVAVATGLDSFAEGIAAVAANSSNRLRVTATNAFASRCLVPLLPAWRASQAKFGLDILGTDTVLDLASGEVDVAIRYARLPPPGLVVSEIAGDRYIAVASPELVGPPPVELTPAELAEFPLIDGQWSPDAPNPPMWFEWQRVARQSHVEVPDLAARVALSFREDLHGIEAAIDGQGVAICSDMLIADAIADGRLVQVSPVTLEGYKFFAVHRRQNPKAAAIAVFESWLAAQFGSRKP